MVLIRTLAGLVAAALIGSVAHAVASDDVPLDEYLRALHGIMPAARDGAEAYMRAFETRCGRAMRTVELRAAVSEGSGDPILMAMIRASHYKDAEILRSLATAVTCAGGGR
ncbi:MAG: hypothetical protein WCF44_12570 [Candidatus Methylophosphatis roskildensis]